MNDEATLERLRGRDGQLATILRRVSGDRPRDEPSPARKYDVGIVGHRLDDEIPAHAVRLAHAPHNDQLVKRHGYESNRRSTDQNQIGV